MNHEDVKRLELLARLNVEDVAVIFNIPKAAVPVLVKHRLLVPLGSPRPNSVRWFARRAIFRLADDERFLHRLTLCLERFYRKRNAQQRPGARASPAGPTEER